MANETLDPWRSVADLCSTATKVGSVLFAGLLLSAAGLLDGVHDYAAALSAVRSVRSYNALAGTVRDQEHREDDAARGQRLVEELTHLASRNCANSRQQYLKALGKPSGARLVSSDEEPCGWTTPPASGTRAADALKSWADSEDALDRVRIPQLGELLKTRREELRATPARVVADLVKDSGTRWEADLITTLLRDPFRSIADRLPGLQDEYVKTRARAQSVAFNLLGIPVSASGYWAWLVWIAFLAIGLSYMWLTRRQVIRQCRAVWMRSNPSVSDPAQTRGRDRLPLWMRPLPREVWANDFRGLARADAAADPLGAVCLLLVVACVVAGVFAILPMAFLANTLIAPNVDEHRWELWMHSGLLCALLGVIVGLIGTWWLPPEARLAVSAEHQSPDQVRLIGRRALLATAAGATAGAVIVFTGLSSMLGPLLLFRRRSPSVRQLTNARRPRIRRARGAAVQLRTPGFYEDERGTIHHVPESGRSKSLAGRTARLIDCKFDLEEVDRVHSTARVAFAYAAARHHLKGLTHRPSRGKAHAGDREKKRLNQLADNQKHFRAVFDIVERLTSFTSSQKPNQTLLALLDAIAVNSQSQPLAHRAAKIRAIHVIRAEFTLQRLEQKRRIQIVQSKVRRSARNGPPGAAVEEHSRHRGRKRAALKRRIKVFLASTPRLLAQAENPTPGIVDLSKPLVSRAVVHDMQPLVLSMLKKNRDAEALVMRTLVDRAFVDQEFSAELAKIPSIAGWRDLPPGIFDDGPFAASDDQANARHVVRTPRKKPRSEDTRNRRKLSRRAGRIF